MVAKRAQPQGVGRRPVDKRIRGRIQGGDTRREWGRNKCVGHCGWKVGRLGAPDTRNQRQRRHGGSRRTGRKERMLFVWTGALALWRQTFFC